MKTRSFLTTVIVAVALMATSAAQAVVPSDHTIMKIITSADTPEDSATEILRRFVRPAMYTSGREVAHIRQLNTDGNGVKSERRLVRDEVNSENYREVVVAETGSDRVYRDTVRHGVWTQELKRGDRPFRTISAAGRVSDTAYSMMDLQEHFELYQKCRIAGTDNNMVQLECLNGPYSRVVAKLDLVGDQICIVAKTMYSDRGEVMKTERRSEFVDVAGKPRPQHAVMVDHGDDRDPNARYDDITTELRLEWQAPVPLTDEVNNL